MEKSLENISGKFNLFDIFSMLIPGLIISALAGISLSYLWLDQWQAAGGGKYVVLVVVGYFVGLVLEELGSLAEKLLSRLFRRKSMRQRFLLPYEKRNPNSGIFRGEAAYQNARKCRQMILEKLELELPEGITEEEINSFVFSYCLNFCELHGLTGKVERMAVMAELSRSLCCGLLLVAVLNVGLLLYGVSSLFLAAEAVGLVLCALLFAKRKTHYEEYRYRLLIRQFYLYCKCREQEEMEKDGK